MFGHCSTCFNVGTFSRATLWRLKMFNQDLQSTTRKYIDAHPVGSLGNKKVRLKRNFYLRG